MRDNPDDLLRILLDVGSLDPRSFRIARAD